MRKINRKGYMLVEIIVSFSIAFVILISLTNLVLKFKDVNEDTYYETKYLKDKNLITRNIMDDLDNAVVTKITMPDKNTIDFYIVRNYTTNPKTPSKIQRRLAIIREDGKTKIKYGQIEKNDDGTVVFNTDDVSYYEKDIEASLTVGDLDVTDKEGTFSVRIPMKSIYTDGTYDINIFSKRVYRLDVNFNVNGEPFNYGYYIDNENRNPNQAILLVDFKVNDNEYLQENDAYFHLEYKSHIELTKLSVRHIEERDDDYYVDYGEIDQDLIIVLYYDSNLNLLKREDCFSTATSTNCKEEYLS